MPNGEPEAPPDDLAAFRQQLETRPSAAEPSPVAPLTLDNVAFHDFAFYQFLLEPSSGYGRAVPNISDRAAAYLDEMENRGATTEALDYMANFLMTLEGIITAAVRDSRLRLEEKDAALEDVLDSLYNEHSYYIGRILELASHNKTFLKRDFYLDITGRFSGFALGTLPPFSWTDLFNEYWAWMLDLPISERQLEYPFTAFPNYSVNVGLRVLYRQEWKPLGTQPGEVVRTIPLGPGQKERVTAKIIQRQKRTSTFEEVTERETTTETTETTKSSSEVVQEAADSLNWSVNTEVSGGFGFVNASVGASAGGTYQDSSKDTTSKLSESMRKAASRLRHQTKVVVATETEETFERERFSEITNPNNEIAVTYKFHKLQHQYEVYTYLAEVQSVIFVAEYLPSPIEVDADWVRRYDWIVARVLKDESYRPILNELIQDANDGELVSGSGSNRFEAMADAAEDRFAKFTSDGAGPGQGGLTVPDIYAEPQRQYSQYLRDSAARRRADEIRRARRERLFQHLRDNILHYCRAIWAQEDPDQRMLRYRKENRRVPFEWKGPLAQMVVGQRPGASQFTPTGVDVPLWDVIDPTGPIAYVGNYSIFKLRPLGSDPSRPGFGPWDDDRAVLIAGLTNGEVVLRLDHVLSEARWEFYRDGRLYDPALDAFLDEARGVMRDDPRRLATLGETEVEDVLSYLPQLWDTLKDANGHTRRNADESLVRPLRVEEWALYLHRKNATRRFLVDSNNVYLSLHVGDGTTLEPFKLAHRYLDVLKAAEEVQAERLRNVRRRNQLLQAGQYDPDVDKVVIVTADPAAVAAAAAAYAAGGRQPAPPAPAPAPVPPAPQPPGG